MEIETTKATYLKALATTLPALMVSSFANLVLLPKLERLWTDAGLTGSSAPGFMEGARFLSNNLNVVVLPRHLDAIVPHFNKNTEVADVVL